MANVERLQQLRRVVQEAPDSLWNMCEVTRRKGCGTARCAIGWVGVDPWFKANTTIKDMFPEKNAAYAVWEQIAPFFDISSEEANHLFGAELGYGDIVTKGQVLANIDRVMSGLPAEPYTPVGNDDEEYDDSNEYD